MSEDRIRFEDGAAYEQMMGVWSRLVGDAFISWTAPARGQRWIDVGCGNGAFTELVVERCSPRHILGVDPSEAQLAFARNRHRAGVAEFRRGDATALPCPDQSFDAAIMALVLFFVPDPAKGVTEMKRVVRPGGSVAAYVWDLLEPGGFPMAPLQEEMVAFGFTRVLPPSPDVSRAEALQTLWSDAGLKDIATREITVSRSFDNFDAFWATAEIAIRMTQSGPPLPADLVDQVKERLRMRLGTDPRGRVTYASRANAVTGLVPS